MKNVHRLAITCATIAGLCVALAVAQPASKDKGKEPEKKPGAAQPEKPVGQPEMTPEQLKEMEAYMQAATPGGMHKLLTDDAGTWEGSAKMWHEPGMPPQESKTSMVITPMYDGRYVKAEITGDPFMPDMPPFEGFGLYGYDNVSKKFQCSWIDNMGTGMMFGTGDVSADGKTLTWTLKYHDPLTKKETIMREVDRKTGENTSTMEMYGPDKTGKEYKMMEISFTRKGGKPASKEKAPAGQ